MNVTRLLFKLFLFIQDGSNFITPVAAAKTHKSLIRALVFYLEQHSFLSVVSVSTKQRRISHKNRKAEVGG